MVFHPHPITKKTRSFPEEKMQCISLKKGSECAFMTRKGCNFNGGQCHPVVEKCVGCSRTLNSDAGIFCSVAPHPETKWRTGNCNFATHIERKRAEEALKINPLKASKRAMASKK
jgi:hypothetical protein